jgi:hypothetical protein
MKRQWQLVSAAAAMFLAIPLLAQDRAFASGQGPNWNAHAAAGTMRKLEAQTGPVVGKPLSATEVRRFTQVLADGTHVDRSDSSTFARDSQGRTRVESPTLALIYDPVARTTYHLTLDKKTFQKVPYDEQAQTYSIAVSENRTSWSSSSSSGGGAGARAGAGSGSGTGAGSSSSSSYSHSSTNTDAHTMTHGDASGTVTEELPQQVLNGVLVKGSRATQIIPPGAIGNDREIKVVTERWFSDDLKVLVKSVTNHPMLGVTTYELTNIVQAQPDPALFQVPFDYTEKVAPRPVLRKQ